MDKIPPDIFKVDYKKLKLTVLFQTTEFDEQIVGKNKNMIKHILKSIHTKFVDDKETAGVLQVYECAALKAGLTVTEIKECYVQDT